ncbi:MAG: MFS transporter [Chloroflexota bacterium]
MNASGVAASTQNYENLNFRNLVYDVLWFGLAFPAIDRFRDIYSIRLGADASQLTLMASLPALMLLVTSSIAGRWMSRYAGSRDAIRIPGVIFRLAFLLPALTAFLPQRFQIGWLVLSVVLPAIGQGVSSVGFVVMMREAVHGGKFAALNGRRIMIMNISVAVSGLAMGFWLEKAPFPLNYQVMFVVAFLLSMVSWWHVDRVKVIPELVAPPPTPSSERVNPWKSPSFQLVAVIVAMCFISFTAIRPLLSLYMVNNLHADEWFLSNFGLIELVAGAAIAAFTVPLVNRFGNRTLIAVGLVGTGMAALIIAIAPSLPVTLISAAVGGASWTIVNIGQFSFFGEMTPIEHKEPFTTAYYQIAFVAMFIGPMIGQVFISANTPIITALIIGAGLRLLAGILTQMHPRQWVTRAMELRLSLR